MAVRVGEAGHDRRAVNVDHARVRMRGADRISGPDGDDLAVRRDDGPVRLRRLRRSGQHRSSGENRLGRG